MRASRRRMFAGLALALAVVLSLTACAQRGPSGGEPAPAPEPVTIVMGRGADADRLDPARTTNGESATVTDNIFDYLVAFDYTSAQLVPGLAKHWDISEDGTEYTFHLREGVKFHDGTPVNADAVLFTFQRQLDDTHPYWYEDMEYAGFTLEPVESVAKVDDMTIRFKLKYPYVPFLANLAMFSNGIVSPAAFEKYGEDFWKNPVGSGPFKFVSWTPDAEIVLEANKEYWNGAPKVDKLVFKVIPDNTVRLAELEAGTVHFINGIDPSTIQRIKDNPNLQLLTLPGLNVSYAAFPFYVEGAPWQKKEVRQAINYALNRENYVNFLYQGAAVPAKGPLPPTILDDPELQGYPYNPDKARELLTAAGYPNGFEMKLYAYPNPRAYNTVGARLAEAIQADLAAVGITVTEIQTFEWTTYLAKSKKGEFDAPFFLGWMGDNGDPDNFLYVLLDEDNIPGGNRAHYRNPEVHDLLIRAQQETDPAARTELYKQAQRIIVDDAPWMFITHATDMGAAVKGLKGFNLHPMSIYRFKNAYLETQ